MDAIRQQEIEEQIQKDKKREKKRKLSPDNGEDI